MRRESIKPDINVTPLVDVVLVLLIIFMVVVPQMEKGPKVEVPNVKYADAKTKVQDEPLVVKLTASGELWLAADKYDRAGLLAKLEAIHQADPTRKIILKGDRAVRYAEVRSLFKQAQELGYPGVALQVGERRDGTGG